MIKSYLAEPGLRAVLFLCIGLLPLAGCGGGEREDSPERRGGAPVSAGRNATPGRAEGSGAATRLCVTLEDRADRRPIPSARISLLLQANRDPGSISVRELWTDSAGVAEETLDDVFRAAAMSEFCSGPSEIDLSGDEASITLAVTTRYALRGRVLAAGSDRAAGGPLEDATVLVYGLRRGTANGAAAPPPLPGMVGGIDTFKKRFFNDLAAECRTDGEGRFECSVEGLQPLIVTAHGEGYVAADWRHVAMEQDDGAGDLDGRIGFSPVEITLRPTAQIEIRFLDPRGRVIAGHDARIRESPFSIHLRQYREKIVVPFSAAASTDRSGVARFTVPAGMEIVVDSRKPESFIPLFEDDGSGRDLSRERPLEEVSVPAGRTGSFIAMPQGNVRIECTVTDREGVPVEGAILSLPRVFSRSDAGGRIAAIVAAQHTWDAAYRVTREGYSTAEGVLPPSLSEGKRVIALAVELEKSPPLVIDAGPQAQNVWCLLREELLHSGRIRSGGEELPPEEALLPPTKRRDEGWYFDHPGGGADCLIQTGLFSFHGVSGNNSGREISFELPEEDQGALLRGTVVVPPGVRPHSVTVTLMRNDVAGVRRFDPLGKRGQMVGWASTAASPKGGADVSDWTFRFDGIVPGRYALGASIVEWGKRSDIYGEITVNGAETPAVELRPPSKRGRLEILVVDRNGEGVVDVDCLLLDPVDAPIAASADMGTHFVTDAEGAIFMDEMVPGRYGFVISGRPLRGVPIAGRVLVEGENESRVVVSID